MLSGDIILTILIATIIISGIGYFINSELNSTEVSKTGIARMAGEKVAETINLVYTNGPGYMVNITLPDGNYTITVNDTGVYVNNITKIDIIPENSNLISPTSMNPGETWEIIYDQNSDKIIFTKIS